MLQRKTKGVLALKKRISLSGIIGAIILIVLIISAIALYYGKKYAEIATGIVAKQMCSCLYVQNRDEAACRGDMAELVGEKFLRPMKLVYMEEKVMVTLFGLSIAEAKLDVGYGCSVRYFDGQMPNGLDLPNN